MTYEAEAATQVTEARGFAEDKIDEIFTKLQNEAQNALTKISNPGVTDAKENYTIVEPNEPDNDDDIFDFSELEDKLDELRNAYLNAPNLPTFTQQQPSTDLDLSDRPALSDVTMPSPPPIGNLEFTATLSLDEVTLTGADFDFTNSPYVSELKTALFNLLKSDIENGDYGINDDDEERIWSRAVDRERRLYDAGIADATRPFTASGFTMPTGAAAAMIAKAQQEVRDKLSLQNDQLLIARGELYSKHKMHTETTAVQLESALMQQYTQHMDRGLKAVVDRIASAVSAATFQLERLKLFAMAYETEAKVFESRVRAESAKADLFKAEVDGAKALVEANKSRIEEFIAYNKATVDVYLAEVEAFKTNTDYYSKVVAAEVEKYRVNAGLFGAYADAYTKGFQVKKDEMRAAYDYVIALIQARTNLQRMAADAEIANANNFTEAGKAAVMAAASTAAAALSGLHVSAGVTSSAGTTYGFGASSQYSESTSTDTNYNIAGAPA